MFTIAIPEPCIEKWTEMKPNNCGRFCSACEKTVVDFTGFSDEAFIAFFRNAKHIPCGRFSERQFSIAIPEYHQSFFSRKGLLRYVAASLLAFTGAYSSAAQGNTVKHTQHPGKVQSNDSTLKTDDTVSPPAAANNPLSETELVDAISIYPTDRHLPGVVINEITIEGIPVRNTFFTDIAVIKPTLWQRLTQPFRKKK